MAVGAARAAHARLEQLESTGAAIDCRLYRVMEIEVRRTGENMNGPVVPAPRLPLVGLTVVLMGTLTASTMVAPSVAVLAKFLVSEFDLSRSSLGLVVTAFALAGALASPLGGWLADRFGGSATQRVVLLLSALALIIAATAASYSAIVLSAAVGGLAHSGANPATNQLIASRLAPGKRGWVTGFKQSGAQVSTLLAGWLLPGLALAWGWRWAMLTLVAVPAGVAILSRATSGNVAPWQQAKPHTVTPSRPHAGSIGKRGLTVYGLFAGVATSATITYIALFALEAVAMSLPVAGALVGTAGAVGALVRIGLGPITERYLGPRRALAWIAGISLGGAQLLAAAPSLGSWAVWIGSVMALSSLSAWTSAGMVTIMEDVDDDAVGRVSGEVLRTFLFGFAIGAPAFGYVVDATGSYTAAWWFVSTVIAAALLCTIQLRSGPRAAGVVGA